MCSKPRYKQIVFKVMIQLSDLSACIGGNIKSKLYSTVKVGLDELVIEINAYDERISHFITRYLAFTSKSTATYKVNFWPYHKLFLDDLRPSSHYIYSRILFNQEFKYRQHKVTGQLDVILPKTYLDWEMDNFLKLYFSSRCANHDMVLLHASALIKNERALLFTGPSGAGKSTIVSLSGKEIIHDDIIAITILPNNCFKLSAIPFKVDYQTKSFTTDKIEFYRIWQSEADYLEHVSPQEQMSIVLFSLWSFDNFLISDMNKYNESVVKFCSVIAKCSQPRNLFFSKSTNFLDLI